MNKVYDIDKEHCHRMIGENVCSRCGGILIPLETINNSGEPTFWSGCEKCSHFDWGVKKRTWQIARKLVTERNVTPYSHMEHWYGKNESYREYWINEQTCAATLLVIHVLDLSETIP